MKHLYKNKELLFFLSLATIYFIWSFDNFFYPIESGLDPSWVLGLNWANNIDAKWGKDFLFTYGPLYHINGCAVSFFYSSQAYLLVQIVINLFYSVIKAGVVFLFYRRANSSYKINTAIFSGVVMLFCIHNKLLYAELISLFTVQLLCYSYFELCESCTVINRRIIVNNILASLLLVVVQYAKFSFFNIAIVLIIILDIVYVLRHKYKVAVVFSGSYIFFSVLLWIISGQSLKNLFGYIYTGLQFSSGYTPAMNIHFVNSDIYNLFVFAFIIIGSFVIMLIYFAVKKKLFYFLSIFFISPQIFLLFKESFVRADGGHAYIFIWSIPLVALYFLFVSVLLPNPSGQSKLFISNSSYFVLITAIFITWISITVSGFKFLPTNQAYHILREYVHYGNRKEETKHKIRKYYSNFDELSLYIDTDEKTDIFPWDISLLYAYDLNWQPRPVIQSYTNYTPALDNLTARHFLTEKAPDKLIYTPMTIDGRYALFDEPETFRTVLLNYSSVAYNDSYLILEKNKQVYPVNMEEMNNITIKTGEIIEVPFCEDAYIFMEVVWDFNFFGKLVNFFFKTTYAHIELYISNGSKSEYRLVHKNAINGLFVSKYVSDTKELMQVFDRDFIPDITGVCVLGSSLFYKNNVKVKFYKITF